MLRGLKISRPPPSVNAATTVARGRKIASREYAAWLDAAIWELNPQPGIVVMSYWSALIRIPGMGSKVDLDNNSKGVMDALVKAGKVGDDRYQVRLQLEFYAGQHVDITVQNECAKFWGPMRGASAALIKKLGG